jgi:hypothetical protein
VFGVWVMGRETYSSVLAAGTLPEGEGVDHNYVRSADNGIAGSIGKLIPRVGGSNLDAGWQSRLDSADLVCELFAGEVSAVEGLGTDGDSVDRVLVLFGNVGDGLEVLLERLLNIRPMKRQ